MRALAFALLAPLLVACSTASSTDDGGAGDSGVKDAAVDARDAAKDVAADAPADAAAPDAGDDAALDPDAGFECTKPTDCMNNAVCCGTLVTGQGQPPNCPITSYGTKCTAPNQCPTNISVTCASTSTVHACATSAQCTEAQYGMCCTFTQGMQTASFCVDSFIAQFATSCN